MRTSKAERILIVDTDRDLRDGLHRALRDDGHEVATTSSGDQAFRMLRDRERAIDWLYSRAVLPGLIDGWILADEYQAARPHRVAIIGARQSRCSGQGHVVIPSPVVWVIRQEIRRLMHLQQSAFRESGVDFDHRRLAA